MKKKVVVKGIINYIVAMLFSIIFALFLDANMGWFMLLALILAPVLSVFFAWISSRYICVFCEMEEALLSKKDTCMMQVHVQNKSIFPTTPIAIKLTNEAGVRSVGQDLSISVMSRMTKSFEIVFQAQICGKSTVGIEDIRVMDYLGLFTFPVKNVERDALKRTVAVIPDIAEISARDDNLIKAMQTSMHTDDSEDTVEAAAYAFGGFPGYDSRDYVPGDPLKRVNWKQSAKRNRLLVRLDDELASKSISVVLDSVFERDKLDVYEYTFLQQYKDCEEEELFPKIAEDAVENALGMMQVLIKHNYTVNFYVMFDGQFQRYEISDENDLEDIRLELAYYGFSAKDNVERIPEELSVGECVSLFSTPNNYEEAICAFAGGVENPYTTIYSVVEEARKQGSAVSTVSLKEFEEKQEEKKEEKKSTRDKVVERVKNLAVPYFLALLLSLSVFGVFDIPVNSWWTIVQAFVCAGTMVFCEYVKKHRVIGTMLTTILVVGLLSISARIVFSKSFGLNYMYWFLSGGDSVDSNFAYLMTLVMVFTVFFCMVTYYFIRVLYRTSFLLLVSMLPFVIYVKVMQDINMVYVVLITVLNIAAFMINTRGEREKDKRKLGQAEGFLSMLIYAIVFVFIGLAVPKEETIFYYMFENAFLGGNVSTSLPEEYSTMSEFSGNADGFNELNDRKLYVISSVNIGTTMYLKRQTFDCYDFEQDRWYPISGYADTFIEQEDWADWQEYRSVVRLAEAFHLANEYEPGFLEKYGMQNLASSYTEGRDIIAIETTNFPSVAYVTPCNSIRVRIQNNHNNDQENTSISRTGVFQREDGFLYANNKYTVDYYDETLARGTWIATGGSNCDVDTAATILWELKTLLEENKEEEYAKVAEVFYKEAEEARYYAKLCAQNTQQIPESVAGLAAEITKDCVYDWEKATALQNYFAANDFVYDLSYRASDDSVEYFLFEGKTGTCSDFASAYVLMARSVGLIVRYVEGFVPEAEYNGEYVVRTQNGHAYPEVYIPNIGFAVYEATRPARIADSNSFGSGITAFFMAIGVRILLVFTVVCAVLLAGLFIHFIAAPSIKETYFLRKIKKASPEQAVVSLYKRIVKTHARAVIQKGGIYTPYEYALQFEETMNYDISELTYLVEDAVYTQRELGVRDSIRAKELYQAARKAIREKQREGKKGKRRA